MRILVQLIGEEPISLPEYQNSHCGDSRSLAGIHREALGALTLNQLLFLVAVTPDALTKWGREARKTNDERVAGTTAEKLNALAITGTALIEKIKEMNQLTGDTHTYELPVSAPKRRLPWNLFLPPLPAPPPERFTEPMENFKRREICRALDDLLRSWVCQCQPICMTGTAEGNERIRRAFWAERTREIVLAGENDGEAPDIVIAVPVPA